MRIFSKKWGIIFVCVIIITGTLTVDISAETPKVPDTSMAEQVFLYNVNTDKMIYSKNANKKVFPGSAVKMMTGLIICERFENDLNELVTITQEMIDASSGWNIKLEADMVVTVEDLLYGLLCGCGNDASIALAIHCSGSVSAFVSDMNNKAAELKMKNTRFTNPTGLDDKNMYSTLSDILIIAKEAYKNKLYLDISSAMSYVYTPQGTEEEIKFFNRNALISNFYALGYRNVNAYGLISGNTSLGGYFTVTYAEKGGTGYLCAVMNAKADDETIYSYSIVNALLEYAFDNYSYVQIAKKGTYICSSKTKFSMPDANDDTEVDCVIMEDVYTLTHRDINPDTDLEYRYYLHSEPLNAPIEEGMIVGGVDILYDGQVIGNAFLITHSGIEASEILLGLNNLRDFFTGRFFLSSILFMIIGLVSYWRIELLIVRKGKRKKRNITKKFY